ncbi:hypothetical protein E6O75_ATG05307 [Venturia nashicola]|uniref:DUF8004 domain-containing protein n=1 Tax=Venturia nashicola TaxID=86259 RepID=A0A4Z1NWK0_9PEZI|nr:hypothetical protein E6O75_ATG05307 [Venturia nashicola]
MISAPPRCWRDAASRERSASIQHDKGAAVAGRSASIQSGGKVERHTWSFINVSTSHDAPLTKRSRELDSLAAPKNPSDNRRYPSPTSGASSPPQTRVSSPEPQPQPRPRSSRGPPNLSLPQVPNFSKTLPVRPATGGLPTILESKAKTASMESLRSRVDGSKVKRWEGHARTTSPWNGIRRVSNAMRERSENRKGIASNDPPRQQDSELFHERGNCSVHFYTKGHSQRGPSIRIPLDIIYNAGFESIFGTFLAEMQSTGVRLLAGAGRPSRTALCDLYIPPPDHVTRASALNWHLTTRNFFAFLMDKPLVGSRLSEALLDLQDRVDWVRPGDPNNHHDLMSYFERCGYLEFSHCPDYALAFLHFAEQSKKHDLWVDAFVHSVGMNEVLTLSPEFDKISHVTKALITRAYLEMDLHLGRATRALSNFLEEDFSPANFGLSSSQRAHLDRFRSFLHTYYVEKFGYWPPPPGSRFSKSLYKSMYFDLRSLYDFLVDLDSSDSLVDQKPASGGICVLQNVQAFDERHKYIPLPHPQPLLPEVAYQTHRSNSQRALRSLKLGSKQVRTEKYFLARDALTAATNSADVTILYAPLVKEYKTFERECTRRPEEKISTRDARKIRWIAIYGILQVLVSVIRAPKEVRDVDSPAYPLCCRVSQLAPWLGGSKSLNAPFIESVNIAANDSTHGFDPSLPTSLADPPHMETLTPIQPDCEGDDYFTHTHTASVTGITMPTRKASINGSATPPRRNSSFKSVSSFSFSTFGSRRTSKIFNATPAPAAGAQKHQPIIIRGYGNGLSYGRAMKPNEIPIEYSTENFPEVVPAIDISAPTPPDSRPASSHFRERSLRRNSSLGQIITPQYGEVEEPERTPTLTCVDIDKMHSLMSGRIEEPDCPSDNSNSTPLTPTWSTRSNSTGSNSSIDENYTRKYRRTSVSTVSTFSTNSTLLASPVGLPIDKEGGATISRSFSVERRNLHELDVQEAMVLPESCLPIAIAVDMSGPQVYQPSGYRSNSVASKRSQLSSAYRSNSGASNSSTLQRPSGSANLSLKMNATGSLRKSGFGSLRNSGFGALAETSETSPPRTAPELDCTPVSSMDNSPVSPLDVTSALPLTKVIRSRHDLPSARSSSSLAKELGTQNKTALRSSLKRSDAAAGIREKRRSVRIKDEVDLLGGIDLNGIVA